MKKKIEITAPLNHAILRKTTVPLDVSNRDP